MAAQADELVAQGAHAEATALYLAAAELAPECDELTFWAGLGVAAQDLDAGVELVRRAATLKPAWLDALGAPVRGPRADRRRGARGPASRRGLRT